MIRLEPSITAGATINAVHDDDPELDAAVDAFRQPWPDGPIVTGDVGLWKATVHHRSILQSRIERARADHGDGVDLARGARLGRELAQELLARAALASRGGKPVDSE